MQKGQTVIRLTDNVKEELKALLMLYTTNGEVGIRLIHNHAGQYSLIWDEVVDGDHVIEYEGAKVLIVGKNLLPSISGITIELENNGNQRELVMYWHGSELFNGS